MAARKKSYPKKPKQSAPLTSWERYEQRVKEVDAYNSRLETEKKRKAALIQRVNKRISGR